MTSTVRFLQEKAGSFFLFGPRGTGKSTWLKATYPNALSFDLLDPVLRREFLSHPEYLKERLAGHHRQVKHSRDADTSLTVVIDEVQHVPALLDVVHQLIEEKTPWRFVLTGSSARKLRRGASNLLAGRVSRAEMHPLMAAELGDAFDLDYALSKGTVPLVWYADNPSDTLAAYVALYLNEEVQAEALVRDIGAFGRFLEAMSFSHASQLNLSAVARESGVNRQTIANYLEVLEDLLLGFRLPVFSRRARRDLVAHEKFYYFDSGVYQSLRPRGPLDRAEEVAGGALEGLVAQHLRAWAAYRNDGEKLYYWRTRHGSEVDFVVYGQKGLWAFEVKHSRRVDRKDLRSLRAFREDYPEAELALLYRGDEPLEIDGIVVLPCDTFLRNLKPWNDPLTGEKL